MFQQIAYEQIQKFVESGRARSIAQRLCTSTPNRRRRRRRHRQRDTKPAVRRQRTTVRLHQCNLLRCAGRRAPTARRSCNPPSTPHISVSAPRSKTNRTNDLKRVLLSFSASLPTSTTQPLISDRFVYENQGTNKISIANNTENTKRYFSLLRVRLQLRSFVFGRLI